MLQLMRAARLAGITAAVVLMAGLGVAVAATPDTYVPPCTANTDACRQQRIVALENHYRTHSHPTATATATSTATSTATATATSTVTATSGPCVKPTATTTGASGTRTNSTVTSLDTNGQTLADVNVSALTINADNVTVRNVQVAEKIIINSSADNTLIDRVTAKHIGFSSPRGTTVQFSRITASVEDDGLHVTSDSGSLIRNVTIRNNLIDNPLPSAAAHYDGLQVRGVDGLLVECNVFDAGAYKDPYNAAVYLEPANGNNANVTVKDNWLIGSAWSVMVFDPISASFTGNQLSGDIHWGTCYSSGLTAANFSQSGNTLNGAPLALCGSG